jgi:hypothetical protein
LSDGADWTADEVKVLRSSRHWPAPESPAPEGSVISVMVPVEAEDVYEALDGSDLRRYSEKTRIMVFFYV